MDNLLIRRTVVVLVSLLITFLGYKGCNSVGDSKEEIKKPPVEKKLRQVETKVAINGKVDYSVSLQGRTAAYKRLDIIPEVTGTFKQGSRAFKEGAIFRKGDVLARIDDRELRSDIKARKSDFQNAINRMLPDLKLDYPNSFPQWSAYFNSIDVNKSLPALPVAKDDRENRYVNGNSIVSTYHNIKTLEIRLTKYVIRAPFTGEVIQGDIQNGELVRQGQPIGVLLDPSKYEFIAPISQQNIDAIRIGDEVVLHDQNDTAQTWKAKVKRISNQIDPTTQSILVYLDVYGKGLRENMFLEGAVFVKPVENAVSISRNSLTRDGQLLVVQDSIIAKQPIQTIHEKGETLIVRGIQDGRSYILSPSNFMVGDKIIPVSVDAN